MRKKSAHKKNANIAELELDVHPKYIKVTDNLSVGPVYLSGFGNPTSYGSGSDLSYLGSMVPMKYKYVLTYLKLKYSELENP
jgi:hypothetical protein